MTAAHPQPRPGAHRAGHAGTGAVTGIDATHIDAILVAARAETARRLATLTGGFHELVAASRDSNADDEHDPEGATIAFERSQLDALVTAARTRLAEIDAAAARLAAGRYGRCESCGVPIAPERLGARPTARTCVVCAERSSGGATRHADR